MPKPRWRYLKNSLFWLAVCSQSFFTIAGLSRLVDFPAVIDQPTSSATDLEFHRKLYTFDLHTDNVLWQLRDMNRLGGGHFDFEKARASDLDGIMMMIPMDMPGALLLGFRDNYPWPAVFDRWVRLDYILGNLRRSIFEYKVKHPNSPGIGFSIGFSDGKADWQREPLDLTIYLGLEGSAIVENPRIDLARLRRRGILMIGPVHLLDNKFGTSNLFRNGDGLSEQGKELVAEMYRQKFVLDLAHTSDQGIDDMLELYPAPPVVSHTGFRKFKDWSRNLSERHLKLVHKRGGLVGLMLAESTAGNHDLERIYEQLEYAIQLTSEDTICIGSDFDGYVATTVNIKTLSTITSFLRKKGYSDQRIAKLMGLNFKTYLERFYAHYADKK